MKPSIIITFLGFIAFIAKYNLKNPLWGQGEYILLSIFTALVVVGICLVDFSKESDHAN